MLPVTRLNFGRIVFVNSSGLHTLGRLECDGRLSVNSKGLPTSCADLWRNGLASSGIYSIKGNKQIEKVYCDISKMPSDAGIVNRIKFSFDNVCAIENIYWKISRRGSVMKTSNLSQYISPCRRIWIWSNRTTRQSRSRTNCSTSEAP